MQRTDVLIVGGGHGGSQAAIALRQNDFSGSITIVGAEPELPYERPPLSKDYLAGEKESARLLIRPSSFWKERQVRMILGRSVDSIDPERHLAFLDGGETLSYGKLIWAAGGRARRLTCTGHSLANVHFIRTRADVDQLRRELPEVRQVTIIGGGYVGLEAAAVLTKLGKKVVLLEAMQRVLARVAGQPISSFYEQEHRAHGVDVRTRASVDCIEEENGVAVGVRLARGDYIPSNLVIVGVGIIPCVDALIACGAEGRDGVHVDQYCRTSLPDVFAIGDCAAHENRFARGARIRLESVQNANDQATIAAKAIVGQASPYVATPWFWSNQYDLKLQTVGLSTGYDQCVVRGDVEARSFSAIYLREGQVIALDSVNAVKDYVQGRKLVEAGQRPDPALLADPGVPLKALMD